MQLCAKRYRFEERLRHFVRVAVDRADAARAEGEARRRSRTPPRRLARQIRHVDVAGRLQVVAAVDQQRSSARAARRRGCSPRRRGEHGRMAARAVVARGDDGRLVAVREHALDGARIEVGPVGEHDQRRARRRRRARRGRSAGRRRGRAPSPGSATTRAPGRSSSGVRALDDDDLVDARLPPARSSTAGRSSSCFGDAVAGRGARREDDGARSRAWSGRLLDLDDRVGCSRCRAVAELADPLDDGEALRRPCR